MRPPTRRQDPLRAPLNGIFGSEGNVRVLRVLAFAHEPMGRTRVAQRAELNPSGVRRVLHRLAEIGLVEAIGSGRNQSVRIRDRHPLACEIRSLFGVERQTFEGFVTSVKKCIEQDGFPGQAAWIENPDARTPGTIHLGVLGAPDVIDHAVGIVQSHVQQAEKDLATHFVVHPYTDADLLVLGEEEAERLNDLTLLYGWLPQEWLERSGGPVRSHRHLDERIRPLAAAIAHLLPNDPSIVDRTRHWIEIRLEVADSRDTRNLLEWRRILDELSLQQIQALLLENGERADRLRQSLPFTEVLTSAERRRLLEGATP